MDEVENNVSDSTKMFEALQLSAAQTSSSRPKIEK